jgi:peroxiredoxin
MQRPVSRDARRAGRCERERLSSRADQGNAANRAFRPQQEKPMPIDVGTTAPDFTLKTQDDKEWKLSSFKGKNVVLLWYPLDWSPTCEGELVKCSNEPVLDHPDTVVVGISRDSTYSHKAWKKERRLKYDLLADPMLEVTKKFGLQHPAVPFISHRATVIVDKTGKVNFVQVQEKTGDERDWKQVQTALKQLK